MLRSVALANLVVLSVAGLFMSACAQGLNGPAEDDTALALRAGTTGSGAGGAKATSTTTQTSTTTAAVTVGSGPSATSTIASSVSSTTGGGTCDATGDCGTCGNCAIAGACQATMNACESDQNCVALLDCLSTCADQTCADGCMTQYPGGQTGYMAVVSCVVCQVCPITCDAAATGCTP